jgi:hypothetical protein
MGTPPRGAISSPYGFEEFSGLRVPHGDKPASEMREELQKQQIEAEVHRRLAIELQKRPAQPQQEQCKQLSFGQAMSIVALLKNQAGVEVNEASSNLDGVNFKYDGSDFVVKAK